MPIIKIDSTNYSGQSGLVTFFASNNPSEPIDLGLRVIPYIRNAPDIYGTYQIYFVDYDKTCSALVDSSTPISTTTTPTPTTTTTTPSPIESTELLLNFDGNLTDDSSNNYTATGTSVIYDSTNKAFGSSSMYGGNLSITGTDAGAIIDSMSGDFTIEFWGCFDYGSPYILFGIQASGGPYEFGAGIYILADWNNFYDAVELYDDTNYYSTLSQSIYNVVPYVVYDFETYSVIPVLKHFAIVRSGSDISIYADGSRLTNFTGSLNIQSGSSNEITIDTGTSNAFWIDSLRISSAALYSGASYVVPTSPLS